MRATKHPLHLRRRAQRTGRHIVLVMDQGNPHHAKAVHRDLELARSGIEVFWLPHYSPELNLIERLWKHFKGTRLANVLFACFEEFMEHVERGHWRTLPVIPTLNCRP